RRRDELEERVVVVVRGVVVARGAVPSNAEPRAEGETRQLVARLGGPPPGAVPVPAPLALLNRAPEEAVDASRAGVGDGDGMGADAVHRDLVVAGGADGGRGVGAPPRG